jgi:hypothetical protein
LYSYGASSNTSFSEKTFGSSSPALRFFAMPLLFVCWGIAPSSDVSDNKIGSIYKLPIFYLPTGDTTKSPEDREVGEREVEEEEEEDEQLEE